MTDDEISEEHQGMVKAVKALTDRRGDNLRLLRDMMFATVVIIALTVAYVQSKDTNDLARAVQDRLICAGRYQDVVDGKQTALLATQGELVVVITQIPPGEVRATAVKDKVAELAVSAEEARRAVNDKSAYNNQDRPLPCPIGDTQPTP